MQAYVREQSLYSSDGHSSWSTSKLVRSLAWGQRAANPSTRPPVSHIGPSTGAPGFSWPELYLWALISNRPVVAASRLYRPHAAPSSAIHSYARSARFTKFPQRTDNSRGSARSFYGTSVILTKGAVLPPLFYRISSHSNSNPPPIVPGQALFHT